MEKKILHSIFTSRAFDSVNTLNTILITDIKNYLKFITKTINIFLTMRINLVESGTSRVFYKQRLNILKNIFDGEIGPIGVVLINGTCNVTCIILNN